MVAGIRRFVIVGDRITKNVAKIITNVVLEEEITIEQIEVSQPTVYSAVLVLYRSRKDSPVHAVAVRVWQGNKQVAEVPTVHCVGLNGKQLRDFLGGVLATLKQKYDIDRFEEKILELKPEQCPIIPCPLKSFES
jgi:hypothetical protein